MTDGEILDAIRGKRFAPAKLEIDLKILSFPQNNHFRVLNAFYLLSTGSTLDALEECKKIKVKVPSNPATLELLYEIYCKLGHRYEAQSVYETAAKKYPASGLILAWYHKSAQMFDAQMMQKSAATLARASPLNREYQLRSAFANFLLAGETSSAEEALQLLDSASAMLEKLQPMQKNQEAFLFASTLMKKHEYSRAVHVLEPVTNKELELIFLFLEGFDRANEWEKLFQYSHTLLFEQSFNDYDTWKYFIKAGYALEKTQAELKSFITFDSRNSFIANIELCRVYGAGFEQSIEAYYGKFKTKPCCAADLSAFEVPDAFKARISTEKSALLEKSSLSDVEVALCSNIEKILLITNKQEIDWERYAKYDNPRLSDLYLGSMIQSFSHELSIAKVLEHIVRLEEFAKVDPENFNIKLWLLNLYSTISGSTMALETYGRLKIKMVQHDTTAYKLNLEPSVRNLDQLTQIYGFYMTGEAEITEFFGVALERGLFTKLENLFRFGKRLRSSLSKYLLVVQILKMCRMLNHNHLEYFLGVASDMKADVLSNTFSVSDNRDFDTDYKLGFHFERKGMFAAEMNKTSEYVQLYFLKELLIIEKHDGETRRLLELYEKWLHAPRFTNTLSPSETHFLKMTLAILKVTKLRSAIDQEPQITYLTKNLDFQMIEHLFLLQTSPLSSSANRILVDCLELAKLINMLLNEEQLKALGKQFQLGLVRYIVTNPEMTHFKNLKVTLDFASLPKSHVDEQLERLEDGIRASKFKMR